MLDLGWPELLVVAIVLIVVVGPKDLPRMLRTFGRTTSKLRSMAGDFRRQFDDALKEAELDEVKGLADQARKLDPRNEIKKHLSPLEKAGKDVREGLDRAMKPKPDAPEAADDKPHEAAPLKAGPDAMPGEAKKAAPKGAAAAPAKGGRKTAARARTPARTSAASAATGKAATAAKSVPAKAKAARKSASGKAPAGKAPASGGKTPAGRKTPAARKTSSGAKT